MSIFKRDHENHLDQLAGYRPTPGEMPVMTNQHPASKWPDLTDAQWAAEQARLALADGRYRLAASFANLAQRAADAAAADAIVAVPMLRTPDQMASMTGPAGSAHGAPDFRDDSGTVPPTYAQLADEVRQAADPVVTNVIPFEQPGQGPTGNGDRDLAEAAKLELFGQGPADTAVLGAPVDLSPRRCRAVVQRDGVQDECLQGIRPVDGPDRVVWVHINAVLDDDHRAVAGLV